MIAREPTARAQYRAPLARDFKPHRLVRPLAGTLLLTLLAACGGGGASSDNGGGGGDGGGGGLSVTVLDNPTSRTPVAGAHVVLYESDNVTIDEARVTGADGRVSFSAGGTDGTRRIKQGDRVSVTVAYDTFGQAEIWTAIDIMPRAVVLFADEELCEGEQGRFGATATGMPGSATRATLDPYRFVASDSTEAAKAVSDVTSGEATFTDVQVCTSAVQPDGTLSALLLASDAAQQLVSYGFAADFAIGTDLDIDASRVPTDMNWSADASTPPAIVSLTATRKGIPYPLSAQAPLGADSGSLPITDQFPADRFHVWGNYTKPSATTCLRSRTYNAPPTDVLIDFSDTDITSLDYDAASDTVSWTRTGTPGDAVSIDLTYLGSSTEAVWSIDRSGAGEEMQVLPQLPAEVEAWLGDRDAFTDLSVAVYDASDADGFDAFVDNVLDVLDVDFLIDIDICSLSVSSVPGGGGGGGGDGGGSTGGSLALTGTGVAMLPSDTFVPTSVNEGADTIQWADAAGSLQLIVVIVNSNPVGVSLVYSNPPGFTIWTVGNISGSVAGVIVDADAVTFAGVTLDNGTTTLVLNGTLER